MTRKKLLIDCDPGQDDAVMLMLALVTRERIRRLRTIAPPVGPAVVDLLVKRLNP